MISRAETIDPGCDDRIELKVYGITCPGLQITRDLVELLERKLVKQNFYNLKKKLWCTFFNPGGRGSRFVSTWSRSRSRSRRQKSISLDGRENLDSFKKLVSTIEKSQSRSRFLDFVSMRLAKPVLFSRDWDFLRQIETFVIICAFCGFLEYFSISIEK